MQGYPKGNQQLVEWTVFWKVLQKYLGCENRETDIKYNTMGLDIDLGYNTENLYLITPQ